MRVNYSKGNVTEDTLVQEQQERQLRANRRRAQHSRRGIEWREGTPRDKFGASRGCGSC